LAQSGSDQLAARELLDPVHLSRPGHTLFWPWYVTWLVGLAPIVGGRRATAATLTFSASVLVLYVMWGNQLPFESRQRLAPAQCRRLRPALLVLWLQLRRGGVADEPVYAHSDGGKVRPATT
jgi:hypothetical protein